MCLDFLPLYFSLDTEVSVTVQMNGAELQRECLDGYSLVLDSAVFKIKCHIYRVCFAIVH